MELLEIILLELFLRLKEYSPENREELGEYKHVARR
jgi:hypothetical protein